MMPEITQADMDRFRAFNEKYQAGIGMYAWKKAFQVAHERLGGDLELGLCWVHASGLAIAVGHRLPTHEERTEARARWNDDFARGHLARLRERYGE